MKVQRKCRSFPVPLWNLLVRNPEIPDLQGDIARLDVHHSTNNALWANSLKFRQVILRIKDSKTEFKTLFSVGGVYRWEIEPETDTRIITTSLEPSKYSFSTGKTYSKSYLTGFKSSIFKLFILSVRLILASGQEIFEFQPSINQTNHVSKRKGRIRDWSQWNKWQCNCRAFNPDTKDWMVNSRQELIEVVLKQLTMDKGPRSLFHLAVRWSTLGRILGFNSLLSTFWRISKILFRNWLRPAPMSPTLSLHLMCTVTTLRSCGMPIFPCSRTSSQLSIK